MQPMAVRTDLGWVGSAHNEERNIRSIPKDSAVRKIAPTLKGDRISSIYMAVPEKHLRERGSNIPSWSIKSQSATCWPMTFNSICRKELIIRIHGGDSKSAIVFDPCTMPSQIGQVKNVHLSLKGLYIPLSEKNLFRQVPDFAQPDRIAYKAFVGVDAGEAAPVLR